MLWLIRVALFYYTLGNILPQHRSALQAIQLVTVVKTSVLETYGPDVILQPFVNSVKELEKVSTSKFYLYVCLCACWMLWHLPVMADTNANLISLISAQSPMQIPVLMQHWYMCNCTSTVCMCLCSK